MTEMCSSPSKANDNYKSKLVNVTLFMSNLHCMLTTNPKLPSYLWKKKIASNWIYQNVIKLL